MLGKLIIVFALLAPNHKGEDPNVWESLSAGVDKAARWVRSDKEERRPLKEVFAEPDPQTASIAEIMADAEVVDSGYLHPDDITDPVKRFADRVKDIFKPKE